jgi:alanine racemase
MAGPGDFHCPPPPAHRKERPVYTPTVIVHLDRLAANLQALRAALRPGVEVVLVVKADAYGHGAVAVARRAWANGIRWFAVAHLHEALEVRAALPTARVVILGALDPADAAPAAAADLRPILAGLDHARRLDAAARAAGVTLTVHVKLDTGMGRLGIRPEDDPDWAEAVLALRALRVEGVCSHFAAVEPHKPEWAGGQVEQFRAAAEALERRVGAPLFKHIASSRACQFHPEYDFDAVRPGILAYGYGGLDATGRVRTRPCLEWKAPLVDVKTLPADRPVGYYGSFRTRHATTLGILGLGYADGLHRALSNRGYVLAEGVRRPLVGRISMNWAAVDLGPRGALGPGDTVTLLGEEGGQSLWADEVARWAGTIAYEVLTAIHPRFPRRTPG